MSLGLGTTGFLALIISVLLESKYISVVEVGLNTVFFLEHSLQPNAYKLIQLRRMDCEGRCLEMTDTCRIMASALTVRTGIEATVEENL